MLYPILDGFQAQVGVSEVRRPFPRLCARKFQDGQSIPKAFYLVSPVTKDQVRAAYSGKAT